MPSMNETVALSIYHYLLTTIERGTVMKRSHIQWFILAVSFVVAVMGFVQLFHDEAYAVGLCNHDNCYEGNMCVDTRICVCGSTVTTCEAWCPNGPCIQ